MRAWSWHQVGLAGDWSAGWRSYQDSRKMVAVQEVRLTHQGS